MTDLFAQRYEVLRPLGQGGMGEVHLVRDRRDGREVALKRLRLTDDEALARFRDEFAVLARIEHPNIVRVFDYGVLPEAEGGGAYFTMEALDGEAIDDAISPGEIAPLLRAVIEIAAGLDALDAAGLVHCDLKPSNVMLVRRPGGAPQVRLLDFGFVGSLEEQASRIRGTPGFLAPEVMAGGPYTRASDAYALGATLYRVVAGRPAFPGESPASVLAAQRRVRPTALPLRALGVPYPLEAALLGLFDPDPERRLAAWRDLVDVAEQQTRRSGDTLSPRRGFGGRGLFVGRSAERARLSAHLLGDRTQLGVIRGPEGSGRTRLARELAAEFELAGWSVRWLDADASPVSRRQPAGDPRAAGLLLVLDDVDRWPARARRELDLSRLAPPLSILATARMDAAPETWTSALLGLAENPRRRDVELRDLDEASAQQLIVTRIGSRMPPRLPEFLRRQIGALPAALHRALDTLLASGALSERDGRWQFDEGPGLAALDVGLASELGEQLAELPAGTHHTLLTLAFDLPVADASDPALRTPRWNGWLDESPGAIGLRSAGLADRLRAELLPAAAPDSLAGIAATLDAAPPTGVRGHRLLGELRLAQGRLTEAREELVAAVRARPDGDDPDSEAAISILLEHCADGSPEGTLILAEVARLDAQAGQNRRAADLWGRVLTSGVDLPLSTRLEMSFERAHALNQVGDFANALATMDAVPFVTKVAAVPECEWWGRRATALHYLGRIHDAVSNLERALTLVPADDGARRAKFENRLAMLLYLQLDPARGRALLRDALTHAQDAGDESLAAIVVGNFGLMSRMEGDLVQAELRQREAIERHQRDGNDYELGLTLASLASTLAGASRWNDFDEVGEQVSEIARRRRDPYLLLNLYATRIPAALRRGRIREARELQQAESVWLPSIRRLEADLHHRLYRAEALRLRGRETRATRLLSSLLAAPEGERLVLYTALAEAMIGRIRARAGSIDDALSGLERARALRPEDSVLGALVDVELARLVARRPQAGPVRAALDRLATAGPGRGFDEGRIREGEAWRTLADGDIDDAAGLFRQAIDAYLAVENRVLAIELAWSAGRALAGRDRSHAAATLLREARGLASASGMRAWAQRLADEILELESRLTPRPGVEGAPPERDTLHRVSEVLNSAFEPGALLPRALALVCDRLGAERGYILLNAEGEDPRPVAHFGPVNEETRVSALDISRSLVRRVTTSGEPFRSDDAATDPRLVSTLSVLDLSMRSILCVPLRLGDDLVGTIYLENRTSAGQFEEEHLDLLEAFANLVAVALQNARLHEELRQSRDRALGENLSLRREVRDRFRPANVVGQSAEIERVLLDVERMAPSKVTVLITGGTGTGKDLIAKTIHFASPRASQPFLSLNCAALPADLIEAELFGIDDHVATGVKGRPGIFERASGGTLFLDEIGDMPLSLQAKLLRVLQEREFVRVGGSRTLRVDVRVIAATNQDLQALIRDGRFREDLYFRLNTLPIYLPPLRERKVDIIPLATHFLRRFCEENQLSLPRMSAEFRGTLLRSDWPGNVRELQNYIERSVIVSPGPTLEPVVLPEDLQPQVESTAARATTSGQPAPGGASPPGNLKAALEDVERHWILAALAAAGGNQRQAAAQLGVAEPTLRYRMGRLGVSQPNPSEAAKPSENRTPTKRSLRDPQNSTHKSRN